MDLDLPVHIAKVGMSPELRRKQAHDLLIELAGLIGEARADTDMDKFIETLAEPKHR